MIVTPNHTEEYEDQTAAFTERDDLVRDTDLEYQYYDDEYEDETEAIFSNNDRSDKDYGLQISTIKAEIANSQLLKDISNNKLGINDPYLSRYSVKRHTSSQSKTGGMDSELPAYLVSISGNVSTVQDSEFTNKTLQMTDTEKNSKEESLLNRSSEAKSGLHLLENVKLGQSSDQIQHNISLQSPSLLPKIDLNSEASLLPNAVRMETFPVQTLSGALTGLNVSNIEFHNPVDEEEDARKNSKNVTRRRESSAKQLLFNAFPPLQLNFSTAINSINQLALNITESSSQFVRNLSSLPPLNLSSFDTILPLNLSLLNLTNNNLTNIFNESIKLATSVLSLNNYPEIKPLNFSGLETLGNFSVLPNLPTWNLNNISSLTSSNMLGSMSNIPTSFSSLMKPQVESSAQVVKAAFNPDSVSSGQSSNFQKRRDRRLSISVSPNTTNYGIKEPLQNIIRHSKNDLKTRLVTIMASVEPTTSAPPIATEIHDNTSLIVAQLVNVGQTEVRRSRTQSLSKKENLISELPKENAVAESQNQTVLYTSVQEDLEHHGPQVGAPVFFSPTELNEEKGSFVISQETGSVIDDPLKTTLPYKSTSTETTHDAVQSLVPYDLPKLSGGTALTEYPRENSEFLGRYSGQINRKNTQGRRVSNRKQYQQQPVTLLKFRAEDRVTESSHKSLVADTSIAESKPHDVLLPTILSNQNLFFKSSKIDKNDEKQLGHFIDERNKSPAISNPFGIPIERINHQISPHTFLYLSNKKKKVSSPLSLRRNRGHKKVATLVYNPNEQRPGKTELQPIPFSTENRDAFDDPGLIKQNFGADEIIERADTTNYRKIEPWVFPSPGLRVAKMEDHSRPQTLALDLIPPSSEIELPANKRRSKLYRYGSWIPNFWSYINPFSSKQDEQDMRPSNNGRTSSVWIQNPNPGLNNPSVPLIDSAQAVQPIKTIPVNTNIKLLDRSRPRDTGILPSEFLSGA